MSTRKPHAAIAQPVQPVQPAEPPQRPWVGLTKEEAADCWSVSAVRTWEAIEAKPKEKNND